MRKNGFARHALIETLHTVQSSFGYLDDNAIRYVARSLRVPLSQAYGVVTFYHYFSLKPPGKHTMTICAGTACYIKGSDKLIAAAEKRAAGLRTEIDSRRGTKPAWPPPTASSIPPVPDRVVPAPEKPRIEAPQIERPKIELAPPPVFAPEAPSTTKP